MLVVAAKISEIGPDSRTSFFTLCPASLQVHIAILLSIIQILFPRRPEVFTPEGKPVDLENSSSAFQRYSMQWCTSVLRLAGENISLDRLPALDHQTRSRTQPLITASEKSLWSYILAERLNGFVKQWALMLMRTVTTFAPPYCVMQLLKSLEDRQGTTKDAWIWLFGIGVSSISDTVLRYHLAWVQWSEMGVPIRAQLITAIFRKALRIKDSKDPNISKKKAASDRPEPINLISSDTLSFAKFTAINYILPQYILKFLFASLFLLRLLGWQSTLVATIATVGSVPIQSILLKRMQSQRKKLTAARDKKTKVMNEALHALRQIKFHALETQWEERIEQVRQEEIKHLRMSLIASNVRSVWKVAAPLIVAAASMGTYGYVEGSLTPAVVFTTIELLPHLEGALGFLPVVFGDYLAAWSNARRMDGFLRRPEQKKILDPSPSGRVVLHNATIAWPSDAVEDEKTQEKNVTSPRRFALHSMDLAFPIGELSVIHGKTGCGKSLLLAAILGEVDLLNGRIEAPSAATGHVVAFVSQTPWLQNATIRDNILFGSPLDEERYDKVLQACSLSPDLAALPAGDETLIGLRGVKLSGGQRARLSLARALYSTAQILVLDDIFSALDVHVSKDIFNALTGELCKGRTRILATHQVSLCLPRTKYIVQIQNNTVGFAGDTDTFEGSRDTVEVEVELATKPSGLANEKPKKPVRAQAKTKTMQTARSDIRVYRNYFSAAGGLHFVVLYLLGLITKQLLNASTRWTLGLLNSTRTAGSAIDQSNATVPVARKGGNLQQYFSLYLLLSLLSVILEYLFNLHALLASLRASTILFRAMTFKVLRMPLLWLDTNPIGDMLKRFTADTKFVDDSVLDAISQFTDCLVKMVIVVGVGYASKSSSLSKCLELLFSSNRYFS